MHAPNVHQGGGKSLLIALLAVGLGSNKRLVQLDRRIALPAHLPENLTTRFVEPSILRRFLAELWLARNVQPQDSILCFGNLPPLFKLSGRVVVFVQNRYLVDDVNLNGFSLKTRLRLKVERLWLTYRMSTADEFVVQTPSMKHLLDIRTLGKIPVVVLPFISNEGGGLRRALPVKRGKERKFDFVYVASGEPHKNHRRLIEAWCELAKEGVFPSLRLTLDKKCFPELCSWVEKKIAQSRLDVQNMGNLPHGKIRLLYDQAGALIFPSSFESFGLPLIEARQAGLPVLASELDYVRDILDPEQTFDPESVVSIVRAVKRFLAIDEQPLPLHDAAGFLKRFYKGVQ